jgi:hypothetical protein
VEVTNTARRSVTLDGWTLQDEDGRTYTFDHYRLEGRSTVRIHTGNGRGTDSDLYQDRRHYIWDNRSDTATLRNDHGRFIDDESWRPPPPRRRPPLTQHRVREPNTPPTPRQNIDVPGQQRPGAPRSTGRAPVTGKPLLSGNQHAHAVPSGPGPSGASTLQGRLFNGRW